MNIFEAYAGHNIEQVEVPEEIVELKTPCGVRFTTEPDYNHETGNYDHVLYKFETGETIIVKSKVDSFHEAYVQYMNKEFDNIQTPHEIKVINF